MFVTTVPITIGIVEQTNASNPILACIFVKNHDKKPLFEKLDFKCVYPGHFYKKSQLTKNVFNMLA